MTKLEEARKIVKMWMAKPYPDDLNSVPKSFLKDVDALIRAAKDEEADTLLRAAELRLQYNDYQEPLFTWHEVQDFLGAIRARISARAKEGK